jgi:polysaccharide export outer membrane protein
MKKYLLIPCLLLLASLCWAQHGGAAPPQLPPTQIPAANANTGSASTRTAPNAALAKDSAHPSAGFQERFPRYELRPGDVFDVNFEFSPEFNQTVTVQPDGFVTLREIGDVQVAGKNVPQLTTVLKQAYGRILNQPNIAIVLKDFEKPYFTAFGQVGRPGKYELRGDVTLAEAIALAGGFTEASKHSQVLLFRRVNDSWLEAKLFNVKKMLNDRSLREDIHLRPGDMIFVPQNRISKFRRYIPSPGVGMTMNPATMP